MAIDAIGGASGFNLTQMAQDIFKKLDSNNDGGIDKSELQSAMKKTGQNVDKIFSEADANGDGKIDKAENENILKKMGEQAPPQSGGMPPGGAQKSSAPRDSSQTSNTTTYDKKDLNQDGTVSILDELVYALKHPNESDSNINALISKLQSDTTYSQQGSMAADKTGTQSLFDITG